ncbi:MAG TPA: hypothetical protein VJ874_00745, partial [Candidatus Thermoplasmatota archaeon]|nr:hypothetical protein [Candidatus Thermoplasmatota archaeon]
MERVAARRSPRKGAGKAALVVAFLLAMAVPASAQDDPGQAVNETVDDSKGLVDETLDGLGEAADSVGDAAEETGKGMGRAGSAVG